MGTFTTCIHKTMVNQMSLQNRGLTTFMTGTKVVVHSESTSNGSDVFSRICYVIIFHDRAYSATSCMATSLFHTIFILAIQKVRVPAVCMSPTERRSQEDTIQSFRLLNTVSWNGCERNPSQPN
jgi:hypothetical protein